MAKGCRLAIIRLFRVFKKLCIKIPDPTTMGEFKKDVVFTMCRNLNLRLATKIRA
jgi:hypothetical protein